MTGTEGTLGFGNLRAIPGFLERSGPQNTSGGDFMNKILRGEMSAVRAYDRVLARFDDLDSSPVRQALLAIRDEHLHSCRQVRQIVREEGFEPSEEMGPWGALVSAALDAASLLGESGALRLLRAGEEHGLRLYEDALDLDLLFQEKRMIRQVLIPRQRSHVENLQRLLTSH